MTIPNTTHRFFVEKLGASNPSQFVGDAGEVFLDPNVPALKLSDGSTPGGISIGGGNSNVLTTQYIPYSGDPNTPIDLTKSVVKIDPGSDYNGYYLADGVEGQVLHLVPSQSSVSNYIGINIEHARWTNGAGIIEEAFGDSWLPFNKGSMPSAIVTLIFTDGHWNLPHNSFD